MSVYVVLDSTELTSNWLGRNLAFRLLRFFVANDLGSVGVPSSVLDEVVANHDRREQEVNRSILKIARERSQLGLPEIGIPSRSSDYREQLTETLTDGLGFEVLPYPTTEHRSIVARAVTRTAPFDDHGSGYRDTLVWETALDLVRRGHSVALVTQDGDFRRGSDLAPELRDEVDALSGTLVLVTDLGAWLLDRLPWDTTSLAEAAAQGRDEDFIRHLTEGDFIDDLYFGTEQVVAPERATSFILDWLEWAGTWTRLPHGQSDNHEVVYDIGVEAAIQATMSESDAIEGGWSYSDANAFGEVRIREFVPVNARLTVRFDLYDSSPEVLSVDIRNADGRPPTVWRRADLSDHPVLFDLVQEDQVLPSPATHRGPSHT